MPAAGDANGDGVVDLQDFLAISQNFNQPGDWQHGDLNGDQHVGFGDFLVLSAKFESTPEPSANVLLWGGLPLLGVARKRPSHNHCEL